VAYLLHIETATRVCSVALSENDRLIALRENDTEAYSHSSLLTVYMEAVMKEAGISAGSLDAVAVSMGPGSYTGLRIGVSAAKGLCYGLDLPLIAVDTLEAMTYYCREQVSKHPAILPVEAKEIIYCPMIDARRMEVYTCLFDSGLGRIRDIEAVIVDADSFSDLPTNKTMLFFGDGAEKCKNIISRTPSFFLDGITTSASGLTAPVYKKFLQKDFVDTAYFEPFYLKDFVAGKPKVKGL